MGIQNVNDAMKLWGIYSSRQMLWTPIFFLSVQHPFSKEHPLLGMAFPSIPFYYQQKSCHISLVLLAPADLSKGMTVTQAWQSDPSLSPLIFGF